MGNLIIRSSSSGSEDRQNAEFASLQYNYPPRSGHNYFSSSYILGSERFETSVPECYLFGENLDLNFLAKPAAFPYLPPQPHEPTRTLRSLINIRRESLRFVKCKEANGDEFVEQSAVKETGQAPEEIKKETVVVTIKEEAKPAKCKNPAKSQQQQQPQSTKADASMITCSSNYNPDTNYNVQFLFDTDVKTAISIYPFAHEEVKPNSLSYCSKNLYLNSPTYFYEAGANQLFSQPNYVFNPSLYNESELVFKPLDEEGNFVTNNSFPFVIQCVSLEGEDPKQSHSLIATIERNHDGKGYALKPFKQKIFIDGLCYLMQEIYGLEKKNPNVNHSNFYSGCNLTGSVGNQPLPPLDDELEDGSECVICMVEERDTLILPCRHLCLCNLCADSLRFQASSCPICRSPFMALLHIKAVRRVGDRVESTMGGSSLTNGHSPVPMMQVDSQNPANSEQPPASIEEIPAGFEGISLIDALNSVAGEETTGAAANSQAFAKQSATSGNIPLKSNSCASLYESTNEEEEEEEEEDSIGGVENIELATGAQLNLSKSSSITTGQQETIQLLDEESEKSPDSIKI